MAVSKWLSQNGAYSNSFFNFKSAIQIFEKLFDHYIREKIQKMSMRWFTWEKGLLKEDDNVFTRREKKLGI